MVYALADAGAKTDPEQGVRFVLEQGSLGQNLEGLGRLFTALAKSDPAAAAKQAAELPGGEALTSALNGVMRTWAQSDAAAARAWIGKLDDAMLAAHATASFAEGLAERDPRAAAAMVGALPDTQNCQETLREIVKMWSGKDTPAALAWIESLPSAEDRSSLAAAALATNLDEKPEEALNQMFAHPKLLGMESGFAMAQALGNLAKSSSPEPWLRRLGELPEEVRPSVVASGLQTWASRDLGAARTWAASQTAEPMRQSAYAALGRVAAKKDETEFKTWIGSQPAGDARDVALLSGTAELVRHASGAQRVALFDLAASASNREYGRSWIRQFASVENAGPELTRWLDATPLLTAQDKAVLRKEQSVR